MKPVNKTKALFIGLIIIGTVSISIAQNITVPIATGTKMIFAPKPLKTKPATQTEFKAGAGIYGSLVLPKPLKEYSRKIHAYDLERYKITGKYTDYLLLRADPVDQDPNQRTWQGITIYLKAADLEKNSIDFEIMPSDSASTFFGTPFCEELANGSVMYPYFGKKIEIKISLLMPSKDFNPDQVVLSANITIDYSTADYQSLNEWKARCIKINENVQLINKQP
ncbi:MAG: hypothetical protein IAF38_12090 [Bacteroidia bacterium]|nr:hypothetical protein [Bacteroidia bacterium]